MKKTITKLTVLFLFVASTLACTSNGETEESDTTEYAYSINVELASDNLNAPSLQSFAHGVEGSNWLLFAGRTNRLNDDGGLHGIVTGDYAAKSFVPLSYNEDIFVYNVDSNTVWGTSFNDMLGSISSYQPANTKMIAALTDYATVFRNSNPLVTQDGDFLYLVGGYGTPLDSTNNSNAYQTFDHVARIHVPSMIHLVKGTGISKIDWNQMFSFGRNTELKSTGAEIFMIEDKLYLAGGHDFGKGALNGQQYVDAVFPFKAVPSSANPLELTITVDTAITDVPVDSLGTVYADNNSTFRRRDGPVVSSLFSDGSTGYLTEGLTFYSGVFQPDSVVIGVDSLGKKTTTKWNRAWPDAIYVHPNNNTTVPYTVDAAYNQKNQNVYACSDFGIFDKTSGSIHTFLLGGIGDGISAGALQLAGFTNSAMQITFDIGDMTSTWSQTQNVFNSDKFYGAESAFMFNAKSNIEFYKTKSGAETELVDSNATFTSANTVDLGYVFGGIESFEENPGTFGPGLSTASSKVWKVTLTRSLITLK